MNEVCSIKVMNSRCVCLEIIDQPYGLNLKELGELKSVNNPGQVGGGDLPVHHWTRDAEASGRNIYVFIADKKTDDLIEALVVTAGINAIQKSVQTILVEFEECDSCVGTSDIPGQDHSGIFLQYRSSRAIRSSASVGPHVPAS